MSLDIVYQTGEYPAYSLNIPLFIKKKKKQEEAADPLFYLFIAKLKNDFTIADMQ